MPFRSCSSRPLLGGSWVVTSGVISPLISVMTIVTLLITPLVTTHEPPINVPQQNAANVRPVSARKRQELDSQTTAQRGLANPRASLQCQEAQEHLD